MADSLVHVVHCSGYSLGEYRRIRRIHGVALKDGGQSSEQFGDWEYVCLNDGGRIATAIRLAARLNAAGFIWSTGFSKLTDSGISEARFMFEYAIKSGSMLSSLHREANWLSGISLFDEESVNTLTSMKVAARMVAANFPNTDVMLHLVSSRNHVPRVIRDATIAFLSSSRVILSGVPASTCYGHRKARDVIVSDLGF